MSYDLSKLLVVGISSRALFDLAEEDRIFQEEGLQAFIEYQRKHEDEAPRPGAAFPLIKGLLGLNSGRSDPKVEVILMSKNSPDVSLRVFNSIHGYGLEMSRAALTGGESLARIWRRSMSAYFFRSPLKTSSSLRTRVSRQG